jgi:hypothetical protein
MLCLDAQQKELVKKKKEDVVEESNKKIGISLEEI